MTECSVYQNQDQVCVCVSACVRACVRACVCVSVWYNIKLPNYSQYELKSEERCN